MNDFIILNGKPFEFTNRQFKVLTIGSSISTSLNGKIHKDFITDVNRWEFEMELDEKAIIRLRNIYKLHSNITFIDYDGQSYTVIWEENEFTPQKTGRNSWTVQFTLRQV